jgi:hypothetical protein
VAKKVSKFVLINHFIEKDAKEGDTNAPQRKFDSDDVRATIANTYLFDEEQLGYTEFLESLVRIAIAYPFTAEE